MPDITDAQLARLDEQMVGVREDLADMRSALRVDSDRNAKEHAEVRRELAEMRLRMVENYATTEMVDRVDQRSREGHDVQTTRMELLAKRVGVVEDAEVRAAGITIGVRSLLVFVGGLIASCSAVIAAVVTLAH